MKRGWNFTRTHTQKTNKPQGFLLLAGPKAWCEHIFILYLKGGRQLKLCSQVDHRKTQCRRRMIRKSSSDFTAFKYWGGHSCILASFLWDVIFFHFICFPPSYYQPRNIFRIYQGFVGFFFSRNFTGFHLAPLIRKQNWVTWQAWWNVSDRASPEKKLTLLATIVYNLAVVSCFYHKESLPVASVHQYSGWPITR